MNRKQPGPGLLDSKGWAGLYESIGGREGGRQIILSD